MTALLIILAVIILLALLRIRVAVKYDETGFQVRANIGCFSFLLFPEKKLKVKKIKKIKKKKIQLIKAGNLEELLNLLKPIKVALSRLKRRLLIKKLDLTYIAGGDDPSDVAMSFGMANAVSGIIIPIFEEHFRIKKRNIEILADFDACKQKVFINFVISMAVWEIVYVAFALLPLIFSGTPVSREKLDTQKNLREEVRENG